MAINAAQHHLIVSVWLLLALLCFIALLFFRAPYGRHNRVGWGANISARLGWVLMESPAIVVMTIFFAVYAANWWETDGVAITLYIIWMAHYIHRSWIWPANARISGKQMPLLIVSFSIIFNSINAWLNAESVYRLNHPYPLEWFYSWQFICGVLLFAIGMGINIKSDYSLFSLRKNGDGEYSIPEGWLFKYVTCPNYLGELIQWIGWAIATWSLAGLSFAVWAAANLVPRARSNHQWYHENFKDYPKDRKRLIPFLW